MKNTCFYHFPCSDGQASAWVFEQAIQPSEDINQKPFYMTGSKPGCKKIDPDDHHHKTIFFLDICPVLDILNRLLQNGNKITILDHHISNQQMVTNIKHPNLEVVFDMDRSGCQITWDFFFSNQERPWFIDYIGDRDLWKFELPNSRLVNTGLYEFGWIDKLSELPMDFKDVQKLIIEPAMIIEQKHQKILSWDMKKSVPKKILVGDQEYKVWLGSTYISLVSELGNLMCENDFEDGQKPDFGVVYNYNLLDNCWKFSLRSKTDGVDVSQIARFFGGGGHRCASGFEIPNTEQGIGQIFYD